MTERDRIQNFIDGLARLSARHGVIEGSARGAGLVVSPGWTGGYAARPRPVAGRFDIEAYEPGADWGHPGDENVSIECWTAAATARARAWHEENAEAIAQAREQTARTTLSQMLSTWYPRDSADLSGVDEELLERSIEVLGNREDAAFWFNAPLLAFNRRTPLEVVSEPDGRDAVFHILGRIEYSGYA